MMSSLVAVEKKHTVLANVKINLREEGHETKKKEKRKKEKN